MWGSICGNSSGIFYFSEGCLYRHHWHRGEDWPSGERWVLSNRFFCWGLAVWIWCDFEVERGDSTDTTLFCWWYLVKNDHSSFRNIAKIIIISLSHSSNHYSSDYQLCSLLSLRALFMRENPSNVFFSVRQLKRGVRQPLKISPWMNSVLFYWVCLRMK